MKFSPQFAKSHLAAFWVVAIAISASSVDSVAFAQEASEQAADQPPVKDLILPGETFLLDGRPAFILFPEERLRATPQPWVHYAPTLPGYPDEHEKWMHEQFLAAGVAVAGIDLGEAYGSPAGQQGMTALYDELTRRRGFATKPCMLGRSRGGLWASSWSIANPDKVAGIAGIYPVFDLRTYPGLDTAAPAYGLSSDELRSSLANHNPIAGGDVLAKKRIPVSIIHGDVDTVVPLEENSATLAAIYKAAGASDVFELIVAEGQGHNFWEGFFRCQPLVDFVIRRAKAGAAEQTPPVDDTVPSSVRADFPGQPSDWNGFDRYDFRVGDHPVLVVAPRNPAPGRPWVWHGEFFGHRPQPDIELLKAGFHVAYMSVPDLLGAPAAVEHWNAFYRVLTEKHGLSRRPALVGLSRGGLYCYNWAIANPDSVACIYGDAPVCDFKSWPGGKGAGKGSPRDWHLVLDVYGFADEDEAMRYEGNPVDNLKPLAAAKVPVLHVYGDSDDVVPWEENTGVIADRYRALGGQVTLIGKPGVGHHPHGLEDSTPIVDFIIRHASAAR
jgi:alpha-beta hydrolase superfamily lysophospholipase